MTFGPHSLLTWLAESDFPAEGGTREGKSGGSEGWGQGMWMSTYGLAAAKKNNPKKQSLSGSDHHSCLLSGGKHLISDHWLSSSFSSLSASLSSWDGDKGKILVCPPSMRLATNCFFYSTLPFLFVIPPLTPPPTVFIHSDVSWNSHFSLL